MLSVYPMTAYSSLQQLGLISPTPVTTPRSWLLPWSPSSTLRWAVFGRQDMSPQSSRFESILFSPATFWLTMTILQNMSAVHHGPTPLCEHEAILGPHNQKLSPHFSKLEKPFILTPFATLRDSLLKRMGWAAKSNPPVSDLRRALPLTDGVNDYTNSTPTPTRQSQTTSSSRIPRITELSTLPSHFLALNLDSFFWTVLLLPIDTLHLRSLASSFLASSTATSSVNTTASNTILGFGSADPGSTLSKVGLCIALQYAVDSIVWSCVYGWSKRIGVQRFHWSNT
jgi:hypothetical protein